MGGRPPQPEMRKPNEKDFFLPTNQVELDEMMSNMQKSGFDREKRSMILPRMTMKEPTIQSHNVAKNCYIKPMFGSKKQKISREKLA